jgi:hypothetical protein
VAPTGTETEAVVAVEDKTVARVAPKNTTLLEAVLLKPVPVSVTVSPGPADNSQNRKCS